MELVIRESDNLVLGTILPRQDRERVLSNYKYPVKTVKATDSMLSMISQIGPSLYYNEQTEQLQETPIL